jgi:tripartite-type tricarboxylate transporter receptor subunit TctC
VVIPLVKSGKLRALAVTSRARWEELPDVPTVAEAGVPGYEISSWIGAMAPAGTPAAVVEKLSDELVAIAQGSDFRDFCARQTMYVEVVERKAFQSGAAAEAARWKYLAQLTKAN